MSERRDRREGERERKGRERGEIDKMRGRERRELDERE